MENTDHTSNHIINHIITDLEEKQLNETAQILRHGNLTLHPVIAAISIHGSRGPKGGFRPDSDLDLSLILKKNVNPTEDLCSEALLLTLDNWQSKVKPGSRYGGAKPDELCGGEETDSRHYEVELDCVVVFDKRGCGLKCFDSEEFDIEKFDKNICKDGTDCLGLYKMQRGFKGFVPECGVKVEMMFPFVKVVVE